jgi:hypothetical protein
VSLLENDDIELPELKTLYDELWSDAKTLFKDLHKSIIICLYAGIVTLCISPLAILSAIIYFSAAIFSGTSNLMVWFYAVVETIAAVVTVSFGAILLIWYRKLHKKYARLIQMEKNIGDK